MSRVMIDSGVDWIGLIPEGWKTVRIKDTSWLKGRIGWQGLKSSEYKETGPYLITGTDFSKGYIDWSSCVRISEERFEEAPEIHIRENDLLITKDGTIGKVAIATNCPSKVSLNSGVLLIRNTKQLKYKDKYLYYTLLSDVFWNWFTSNLTGSSTIVHLYQEQFYNFKFFLPPLPEQQSIAAFLDNKCEEIDNLISLQEKMIEELLDYKKSVITEAVTKGLNPDVSMRDSGIDWIGLIPEEWEISILKRYLNNRMQYGANESAELDNPDFPRFIRITDLTIDGKLKQDTFKSLHPDKANGFLLEKGDILFARSGATVGKCFLFNENIKACFAGYLIKASCNNKLKPLYLFYYTQSHCYENWKNSIFIQATIQNIGADKYSLLPIVIPPLPEQQAIADYLDNKCIEIENLIAIKRKKIESLKEYRKSLIFEYVTGKKEVQFN